MRGEYMLPFIGVMALDIVLTFLFTFILSKTKLNSRKVD